MITVTIAKFYLLSLLLMLLFILSFIEEMNHDYYGSLETLSIHTHDGHAQ